MNNHKTTGIAELKDNLSEIFGNLTKLFSTTAKMGEELKNVLNKNIICFNECINKFKNINNNPLLSIVSKSANREENSRNLSSIIGEETTKKVESNYVNIQKSGIGSYKDISYVTQSLAINGIKCEDLNKSTEAILKFSKVAKIDLNSSLETLTHISKNTGKNIEDLTDIISTVQTKFKLTNLNEFNNSLKNLTYYTKQANVSTEEIISTLGFLSTKMSTFDASDGLNNLLNKAPQLIQKLNMNDVFKVDGTLDIVKFLTQIEQKTKSFSSTKLKSIFTQEELQIIKETAKHSTYLKNSINEVTTSYKGQLNINYNDYANSFNNSLVKLQESWANLSVILGGSFLPYLTTLINKVANVIFRFNEFIEKNESAKAIIVSLTTVLGILIAGFTTFNIIAFANSILGLTSILSILKVALTAVTITFRALTAAMLTNPITAIISLISLGAYLIIENWEKLKQWFLSFFKWIENTKVYKFLSGYIKKFFGGESEIKIDNTSSESIKDNSPLINNKSSNNSTIENNQQYNINVTSYSSDPKDISSEVIRSLNKSHVGS